MEEVRTDEEIERTKEALKLIEAIVLVPGPEEWAEAFKSLEKAVPFGVPDMVYDFYKGKTAYLLHMVFFKVFLYGLKVLNENIGAEELDRRIKELDKFIQEGKDARQGT